MSVRWIECLGENFKHMVNLYIGDECIALVRDKETVDLVKRELDHKNYIEKQRVIITKDTQERSYGGLTNGYSCPFCETNEEDGCNC